MRKGNRRPDAVVAANALSAVEKYALDRLILADERPEFREHREVFRADIFF